MGGEFDNPTINGGMVNRDPTLRLYLFNLSVTEFVSKIISNGFENNFRKEMATFKHDEPVC